MDLNTDNTNRPANVEAAHGALALDRELQITKQRREKEKQSNPTAQKRGHGFKGKGSRVIWGRG